jgi:proteasome lid subunit RPN8/RPN11
MTLTIDAAAFAAMRSHAEQAFPEECCGVLFASPTGLVVRRMTNIQNQLHATDPAHHPRDARTAYEPEPREFFEVNRQSDQPGWRIAAFYHSHPDHDAYFSPTDKDRASYDDPESGREPLYPGVVWLVLSVYERTVRAMKAYAWNDTRRDFLEVSFSVIPRAEA